MSRPLVACRQPWKPYWEQEIVLPVARNLITRPTQNRSWPAETEAHRIGWKWLVATGCLVFPNEFKYGKQIRELNEPGSSPQAAPPIAEDEDLATERIATDHVLPLRVYRLTDTFAPSGKSSSNSVSGMSSGRTVIVSLFTLTSYDSLLLLPKFAVKWASTGIQPPLDNWWAFIDFTSEYKAAVSSEVSSGRHEHRKCNFIASAAPEITRYGRGSVLFFPKDAARYEPKTTEEESSSAKIRRVRLRG